MLFDFGSRMVRAETGGHSNNEAKAGNVTVAAIVTPQMADGSAWDIGFGADLVLCGEKGCYVSAGLTQPASFYEGGSGLRLLKKAGACRDQLQCVFRGVDPQRLGGSGTVTLQLVDVDYVAHHYMEGVPVAGAMACELTGAALQCAGGVHKRTFSLWIIDEAVADKGGKEGLDHVLFKGLLHQRIQAMTRSLEPLRRDIKVSVQRFYHLLLKREVPQNCLARTDFLSETFFIAGLADSLQRRSEPLIKSFVGETSEGRVQDMIQRSPELYWGFLDIAEQLKGFSKARQAMFRENEAGLRLHEDEASTKGLVLTYGWRVKARAKTLLEACLARKAQLPLSGSGG